jgi:hypothetical protein
MINPDQPRSAKLLFSKEELAPDDRSQATRATQKQPKKVKPAQKKAESPRTQPVDRADEHIPAENNKLKRDRSFLRDSDQDVNDQRASIDSSMRSRQICNPKDKKHPLKISITTASRMNLLMLTAERLLASVRSLPGKNLPHRLVKQQNLHRAIPEPHLVKLRKKA